MVRFSFVMLAGFILAGPVSAATWADQLFDQLSKDFGSVARGPAVVHHFRLTNKTKETINISNVRVSCGCTSAQALKTLLEPGETTSIQATMDTTRFLGAKSVTIFVQFDRPRFDEVRLLVQASSRDDFNITPDVLAFGQIKKGATPSINTTITFYSLTPVLITGSRSETNYITPEIKEINRQNNLIAYQLTASLRGDAPPGKWFSDIWIQTNAPTLPQIRVPVTLEIESPLSVTPEVVTLGEMNSKSEVERRVVLRGSRPFKITRIEGGKGQVDVTEAQAEEKKIHILSVKIKPEEAGSFSWTIKVITDLDTDSQIEFQVNGQVNP